MFDDTTLGVLDFHRSMLEDELRTDLFMRAILETVRVGDVVLDIGTGTGVLALFACAAGAKKVYAVEQGPVIDLAREIAAVNDYGDRIEFIHGWSTEVTLPEPVDVIVTETIGNMAFDEGIVASVVDARDRLLANGGKTIPMSVDLVCVLVEGYDEYAEIEVWSHPFRTFDFSPLWARAGSTPISVQLSPVALASEPETLISVDLSKAAAAAMRASAELVASRSAVIHGVGCWFQSDIAPGITASNAPPNSMPSWGQDLLPLAMPMRAEPGDRFHVEIAVDPGGTEWSWRVTRATEAGASVAAWQSTKVGQLTAQVPQARLR